MELKLHTEDLKVLASQGLLNDIIMKCTVPSEKSKHDEVTEEKPKKKRATRKKTEEAVAEASQEVAEMTAPSPIKEETAVEETPTIADNSEMETTTVEPPNIEFNIEQLAQKAISLMDAGRGTDLQALLQQFGVASLPELAPENYSAFYSAMEEL